MSAFDFGFEEYFADRGDFVDLAEVEKAGALVEGAVVTEVIGEQ